MKTQLTVIYLIFFAVLNSFSQTETYQINWTFGVNGAAASRTIEEGDTIEWVWGDPNFHTVSNKPGSTETFDSGGLNGMGTVYSHTFTAVGANDYQCDFHAASMFGTITVVAEGTLSIINLTKVNFSIYPNPANSILNFKIPLNSSKISVRIYDIMGKQLYANKQLEPKIDIAHFNKGMYFVNLYSEDVNEVKRFIKY